LESEEEEEEEEAELGGGEEGWDAELGRTESEGTR